MLAVCASQVSSNQPVRWLDGKPKNDLPTLIDLPDGSPQAAKIRVERFVRAGDSCGFVLTKPQPKNEVSQ